MSNSRYKIRIYLFVTWITEQMLIYDIQCLLTDCSITMVGLDILIHLFQRLRNQNDHTYGQL